MSNVIKLVGVAPVSVDPEQMGEWAAEWVSAIMSGRFGKPRTLVIMMEADDGHLGLVSQSTAQLDAARLIGLMHVAAHRTAEGGCRLLPADD